MSSLEPIVDAEQVDFFEERGLHLLAVAMVEQALLSIIKQSPEAREEQEWLQSDAGHMFVSEALPGVQPAIIVGKVIESKLIAQRVLGVLRSSATSPDMPSSGGIQSHSISAVDFVPLIASAEANSLDALDEAPVFAG